MNRISSFRTLNSVVEGISEVAHYLWEKGWAEIHEGNLSGDDADRGVG